MRCRMRSAATIWYGRITSSLRSTSNTQYLVRTFSSECFAKKVLVKPVSSVIGWFFASAHQFVNEKLFEVLLVQMPVAHGIAVILGQRAIADDEELRILEQARARPEAVALVAVDLIEG